MQFHWILNGVKGVGKVKCVLNFIWIVGNAIQRFSHKFNDWLNLVHECIK